MRRGLVVASLLLAACAPTLPKAEVASHAAGDRAFSAGRFEEAAARYREAAQAADRAQHREDFLYLEAASLWRAQKYKEAQQRFEELEKLNPQGKRGVRAAFDAAQIEVTRGDAAKGWAMHEAALRRHASGLMARRELSRYVLHLDESQGDAAALAWLRANLSWLKNKETGETAAYLVAEHLEKLGNLAEARDAFLQCAKAYPYPEGALNDDSYFRASLIDEKLGDLKAAVEHLRELLSHRESAWGNGSYERPRYSPSQMRIATLYRDGIKDRAQARKEFRRLFTDHPTSILRDDALWQEARIAKEDGDEQGACDAVSLLVRKVPESRYAPCGQLLCPSAPAPDKGRACHSYIAREVNPGSEQHKE
jgi:tetratricopeptide (TPR) repeat protein